MKKIGLITLITLLTLTACSEKEINFTLNGTVKGLKKGKIYLQKMEDTLVVNIDSVTIDGDSDFTLATYLKEPEILFVYLDKSKGEKNDDIVEFFAEPGEMTMTSSLENFTMDATFKGSTNQDKLSKYQSTMRKFNNQHLDLIKENFEAQQADNEDKILETNKKYENWLRRKYLYTINYAINNKNLEIAPYLALSEVFDAKTPYLDTIYNSLDKKIKKSKYGKELKKYIKKKKKIQKHPAKISVKEEEKETTK